MSHSGEDTSFGGYDVSEEFDQNPQDLLSLDDINSGAFDPSFDNHLQDTSTTSAILDQSAFSWLPRNTQGSHQHSRGDSSTDPLQEDNSPPFQSSNFPNNHNAMEPDPSYSMGQSGLDHTSTPAIDPHLQESSTAPPSYDSHADFAHGAATGIAQDGVQAMPMGNPGWPLNRPMDSTRAPEINMLHDSLVPASVSRNGTTQRQSKPDTDLTQQTRAGMTQSDQAPTQYVEEPVETLEDLETRDGFMALKTFRRQRRAKLYPLDVPGDDVANADTNSKKAMFTHQFHAALMEDYADEDSVAASEEWDQNKQDDYLVQQERGMIYVKKELHTAEGRLSALSNCLELLQEVYKIHEEGVPPLHHTTNARKQMPKGKFLTEKTIKFSTRVHGVTKAIKENKLIAEDVVKGITNDLLNLARAPHNYLQRKLDNVTSNGGKKGKKDNTEAANKIRAAKKAAKAQAEGDDVEVDAAGMQVAVAMNGGISMASDNTPAPPIQNGGKRGRSAMSEDDEEEREDEGYAPKRRKTKATKKEMGKKRQTRKRRDLGSNYTKDDESTTQPLQAHRTIARQNNTGNVSQVNNMGDITQGAATPGIGFAAPPSMYHAPNQANYQNVVHNNYYGHPFLQSHPDMMVSEHAPTLNLLRNNGWPLAFNGLAPQSQSANANGGAQDQANEKGFDLQ